jgi:hypothetical protein
MKFKIAVLLMMVVFVKIAAAQDTCNCEGTLTKLIVKIESEYPGLAEKTKDSLLYNTLKTNLIAESKITKDTLCLSVLKKYTGFFKDSHIWILPAPKKIIKQPGEPTFKIMNISTKAFKKRIANTTDKLEGVWKADNYTIGIIKTGKDEYTGFVMEADWKFWKPNEIKFKLVKGKHFEYLMQDHSLQEGSYTLYDESIIYFNEVRSAFVKQNPAAKLDSASAEHKINEIEGFYVKKLTAKTTLIRLSNFSYGYVDRIEKLIAQNRAVLEQSENLIIDLRDNGGGTDIAYTKLLPFIMTGPLRYVGVEYLATQTLIDGLETYKNGLKDLEKYKLEIEGINRNIEIFKKNIGKFVNTEKKAVTIDTIKLEQNSPKQIVILSNKMVGSAAENLLLSAKQSKKVKILGTPSFGVLDYASARFFNFGCSNYQLLLPTYRSLRLPGYPIDNIGIQPDVYLDDSIKDWIYYAVKYLESN